MIKYFLRAIVGFVLFTAACSGSQSSTVTASLQHLDLVGRWICSQQGPYSGTGIQDWAPAAGGKWLRATDTIAGQITGEHVLTFNKATKAFTIIGYFWTGSYDVATGLAAGPDRIIFHTVYPHTSNLRFMYVRTTPTRYVYDQSDAKRKQVRIHTVCNRQK